MRSLRVALPVLAVVVGVGLAGCVPSGSPTASPSSSDSASSSASASPTPDPGGHDSAPPAVTPSPSPVGRPKSTLLATTCDQLVTNQDVYDFNPIYSARTPATPPSGSEVAAVQASGGRTCQWVNTSDGTTIDLAVGQYDDATVQKLAKTYSGGQAIPGWGPDAWYTTSNGVGIGVIADGRTWVVASSSAFGSDADAGAFVDTAYRHIG